MAEYAADVDRKTYEAEYDAAKKYLDSLGYTDSKFAFVRSFIARAIIAYKAKKYPTAS